MGFIGGSILGPVMFNILLMTWKIEFAGDIKLLGGGRGRGAKGSGHYRRHNLNP